MTNKALYLLACFACLFLSACSSSESSNGETVATDTTAMVTNSDTTVLEADNAFDFSKNFVRTYQGTIGNIPIHLNLIKTEGDLKGYYYYDKKGIPINLNEGEITSKGFFSFKEHDSEYNETGLFVGQIKGNNLEAVWQSADRTKKLEVLMAYQPSGVEGQLSCQIFHDSRTTFYTANDTTSPRYTFNYDIIFPSKDYQGPAKEKLYQQIESFFGELKVANNPWQSIEAVHNASFKEYKENIADFVGEADMAFALNWSSITEMEVLYNDKDILSVAWDYYSFTGGAHGNYGRGLHSYVISTGKKIVLTDLFDKGFEAPLKALILQSVANAKGIPQGQSLTDAGFDEEAIVPTDNLFITHTGIGFYYSPYEIASYAAGATEVFIPFSACQRFLKPNGIVKQLSL